MAVTVDSEMASNTSAHGGAVSSLTFSFTNTSGTTIAVKAHVTHSTATVATIDSVTYGGVALTKQVEKANASSASPRNRSTIWTLSSGVLTGANNVVITLSGTVDGVFGEAITVTGESGSIGVTNTNFDDGSSSSHSLTLAGTTSGSLALFGGACGSSISTRSQTKSASLNSSPSYSGDNSTLDRAAGGGSITDSWTSSAADYWTSVGLELLAAGASAALSGSASTGGSGTGVPGIEIGL